MNHASQADSNLVILPVLFSFLNGYVDLHMTFSAVFPVKTRT